MKIFFNPVRSIGNTILYSLITTYSLSCLAENQSVSIGSIRNPSLLKPQAIFCNLHLFNDLQKRNVFMSAYHSQFKSTALMNIDGRDLMLTSVRKVTTKRGSIATYRAENLNVKVNYIQTSEINEGASYDATMTIARGNKSKVIAVTGACGT